MTKRQSLPLRPNTRAGSPTGHHGRSSNPAATAATTSSQARSALEAETGQTQPEDDEKTILILSQLQLLPALPPNEITRTAALSISSAERSEAEETLQAAMASQAALTKGRSSLHSTAAGMTEDSGQNRESILSVRRLTPTECEVLQGFPKGWTVPATKRSATPSRSRLRNGSAGGLSPLRKRLPKREKRTAKTKEL